MRKGYIIAVALLCLGLIGFLSLDRNTSTQASWSETKFEGQSENWSGSYVVTPRESQELGFTDMLKVIYKKPDQMRDVITIRLRMENGNEITKKGPYTLDGIQIPGGGSYDPAVLRENKLQLTVEWNGQIEHIELVSR